MSFQMSLTFISHSVRYVNDFAHLFGLLSLSSYTSTVIVSHPFCKKPGSFVQSFLLNSTHVPFVRTLSSFYQQSITIVWELQVFVTYIRNSVRASEAFVESHRNCRYSWDSIRYKKENEKRAYSPAPDSDISYFCNKSTNIFWLFYTYKLLSVEPVGITKAFRLIYWIEINIK